MKAWSASNVRYSLAALVSGALLLLPQTVNAQACLGNHAQSGEGSLIAEASTNEDAWSLASRGSQNFSGPLNLTVSYGNTWVRGTDFRVSSSGASLGWELLGGNLGELSVCPTAGLGYGWVSNAPTGVEADGVSVSGGVQIGAVRAAGGGEPSSGGHFFTPYASFNLVHTEASASVAGVSASAGESYGVGSLGFIVGTDTIYLGPTVAVTTEDGPATLSLRAGVSF